MAQTTVTVNGRSYQVGCDDGEEEHIADLAAFLDKRVRELADKVGQVGEARLLLMAGLMIADDLATAYDRVDDLRAEIAKLRDQATATGTGEGTTLSRLAERLEVVARRLESA